MKVLDLFSGIGGFSLGLERAGMETVAFCEIDEFCRKVLAKHWPNVPIHNDIKTLKGNQYGSIDIICGGFPCQPFSTAGKRKGKDDNRDLWPEMFRVIREARPAWVIGENVAGFINMEFERTANDLEAEGYEIQAFIIPACAVGAPHRRDRLWILANAGSGRCSESQSRETQQSRGAEIECSSQDMANPDSDHELGRIGNVQMGWERITGQITDYGNARGIEWPVEPAVGRVANGVPNRVDRLKSLGNAVIPQIPEIIGRAIMSLEWAKTAVVGELNPHVWGAI